MPSYRYRCDGCGPFEVRRSLTEPDTGQCCPACDRRARRVFEAPAVRGMASGMRRALEAQERSAHQPAVVGTPPSSRRATPVSTDPRHARLPRP